MEEAVDGLEYLKTPDKVNYLIEKFDDRTLYDWEYFKSKSSGRTYDRFFNFILDCYDNDSEHRATIKWIAKGTAVTCPACGDVTPVGKQLSHCLEHCKNYMAMSPNQQSECVQQANWCPIHLSGTHDLHNCNQKNDLQLTCSVEGCTKHHHRSLHGSTTPYVVAINAVVAGDNASITNHDNVLLSMQEVPTLSGEVNTFFDDGSTCCLILLSTTKRLGLRGEDVVLTLKTVNGDENLDTKLFCLSLVDSSNLRHPIKAFGVPNISGIITRP